MCSSMKQPKPERLVEMLGMPITVHSAAEGERRAEGCSSPAVFLNLPKAQTAPLTGSFTECGRGAKTD